MKEIDQIYHRLVVLGDTDAKLRYKDLYEILYPPYHDCLIDVDGFSYGHNGPCDGNAERRCSKCRRGMLIRSVFKNSLGSFCLQVNHIEDPEDNQTWTISIYRGKIHKRWTGTSLEVFLLIFDDVVSERDEFFSSLFNTTKRDNIIDPSDLIEAINGKYDVNDIIARLAA